MDRVTSTETKKAFTIPYILKGEFFKILKQEGDAVTVQCMKCPQQNIYKGSVKSTGNFHMHIKRKHPGSLGRLQELKLKSFMDRKLRFSDKLSSQAFLNISPEQMDNVNINKVENQNIRQTQSMSNHLNQKAYYKDDDKYSRPVHNRRVVCESNSPSVTKDVLNFSNHSNILKNSTQSVHLGDHKSGSTCRSSATELEGFYSLSQQNGQASQSRPSVPADQTYIFQHNTTAANGMPISATLTAASMILTPAQEVLGRIDNHLKCIERQLQLRNQIETNRIYLDLAKFKYLHPNFAFQG